LTVATCSREDVNSGGADEHLKVSNVWFLVGCVCVSRCAVVPHNFSNTRSHYSEYVENLWGGLSPNPTFVLALNRQQGKT